MKVIIETDGDMVNYVAAFEKIGNKAKNYLKDYYQLTDEQIKMLIEEDCVQPYDDDDILLWIRPAELTLGD